MVRGIAPLVESWRRRAGGRWATPATGTGSAGGTRPVVEIYVHEAWTDISDWVRYEEGIRIRRGRTDEATRLQHGQCSLVLDNRDGRFSRRNPLGPYYGQLIKNTPVRVWRPQQEIRRYRFTGEVTGWPSRWDTTGQDIYVQIEAAGITQRWSEGTKSSRSPIFRGLVTAAPRPPVAYWPCEDGTDATQFASGLPGGTPMAFSGAPQLGSFTGFVASESLPVVSSSVWRGHVPTYAASNEAQIRFLINFPDSGLTNGAVICRVRTTGTASIWDLIYSAGSGGGLFLRGRDTDGATLFTSLTFLEYDGKSWRLSIELMQNGGNIDWSWGECEVGQSGGVGASGTLVGYTFGAVASVEIAPFRDVTDAAIGHISVHDEVTPLNDLATELTAYDGETAGRRIERLCREEGIAFQPVGDLDDTELMGTQGVAAVLELIQEAVDADLGILYEPRDQLGLGYRTRRSLYNQTPRLTLDYSAAEVGGPMEPADDGKDTVNRAVASRKGGSSETVELTSGPLSVQAPPDGVHPYERQVTVNVQADSQLPDVAGWQVRLGTVDEDRQPKITVNLGNERIAADTTLVTGALVADQGDVVAITNLIQQLAPDDTRQMVQSTEEMLRWPEHELTFTCSPGSPWTVAVADTGTYGCLDTSGSIVAESLVDADEVFIDVHTTADTALPWVTSNGVAGTGYASHFPFDITVGGERMSVLGCESWAWDTFTRTVSNGWGTSASGHAWGLVLGLASERAVNGSAGTVTLASSPSTNRIQQLVSELTDSELLVSVTPDQLAAGDSFLPGLFFRGDITRLYQCRLVLGTSGSVGIQVTDHLGVIGSTVTTRYTYGAGTKLWLRARLDGLRMRGRVWVDGPGRPEPGAWQIDVTVPSGPNTYGSIGTAVSAGAGNTNVNPQFAFDDFEVVTPQRMAVTRAVNGVVKTHSLGAPVRVFQPAYTAW